jgi:succinate dehydrogenase/fumarate reductase flavoprotein subunit
VFDLVVAGAGMGGLVAAAEARRLGARPLVLEKLAHPGGSMRLSSGVVWRHRELDRFVAECPHGDERLQRTLHERLDGDLDWLESLGAPVLVRETGNALTSGRRFDPEGLTVALAKAAGELRLESPLEGLPDGKPVILATGGFAASGELVREHVTAQAAHLLLRASPGSTGDGLRLGQEAGAGTSAGMDEIYGRNMPAPPARVEPRDFVRLGQLYAQHADVVNTRGERHRPTTWSEIDVLQWSSRQPGARALFRVPRSSLAKRVRERSVGEMVEAAERAGGPVKRATEAVEVETVAGITTTLGGLRVDARAQAAPGVYACGGDTGGMATGGYASGLATALVLGRIAARSALGEG